MWSCQQVNLEIEYARRQSLKSISLKHLQLFLEMASPSVRPICNLPLPDIRYLRNTSEVLPMPQKQISLVANLVESKSTSFFWEPSYTFRDGRGNAMGIEIWSTNIKYFESICNSLCSRIPDCCRWNFFKLNIPGCNGQIPLTRATADHKIARKSILRDLLPTLEKNPKARLLQESLPSFLNRPTCLWASSNLESRTSTVDTSSIPRKEPQISYVSSYLSMIDDRKGI